MAIFEKIECSIAIDRENLPEYDCPPDHDASAANDDSIEGPLVEKYIEAQPDQNFAVRFHLQDQFSFGDRDRLVFYVYIDGAQSWQAGRVIGPKDLSKDGSYTDYVEGRRRNVNGAGVLHKFRFSKLIASDLAKQRSRLNVKNLKGLGDIVVEVRRANCVLSGRIQNDKGGLQLSSLQFTEQQAKGRTIDAFTLLDEPVPHELVHYTSLKEETQLVQFVFHYRGRDVLQQLGIMERPLNERSLEERDPASLTHEEVLELLRRTKEVVQQQEDTEKLMKKRLRQAEARHNLRTLDAIKRGRSPSPRYDGGEADENEEVQIVKRAKKDKKIEVVELD